MSKRLETNLEGFIIFCFLSTLGFLFLYLFGLEGISNDLENYIGLFERLNYTSFNESLIGEITEPGYLLFAWILSKYFSADFLFILAGLFPLLYKINILRRIDYGFAAVLFYFLLFLPIQESNQIRGALAGCFILFSLLLDQKRPLYYLLLGLTASLFHYSGIIIVAFYVFRITRSNLISLSGLLLVSLVWNTLLSEVSLLSFLAHQASAEDEIGITFTNPIFWLQVSIIISTLFIYRQLTYQQKKGFHLILLGAATYVLFADTPVIAHRIRELSLLGLFPLIFTRASKTTYSGLYNFIAAFTMGSYTFYLNFSEVLSFFSIF